MTRVIRCLRVLNLEREALGFVEALKKVHDSSTISDSSLMYWTRAAYRPLNIAPDVSPREEKYYLGRKFLKSFEDKRLRKEADSLENLPVSEDSADQNVKGSLGSIETGLINKVGMENKNMNTN